MARGVSIEHVSFSYGATAVLDDISLDVAKGEFFAFLGPSGSGKSTLLRLIAGFGTPAAGRVLLGNVQVRTDSNVLVGSGDVIVQAVTP